MAWNDKIWFFDFEVFAHDWILCAKSINGKDTFYAHNDNVAVYNFVLNHDIILCGYNNKHYDNYLLKGILANFSPEKIKEINDFIIVEENNPWEYDFGEYKFLRIPPTTDLIDDVVPRISLKEIEGFLLMNIVECGVDFGIKRPLTNEELVEVTEYCWHDVNALFPLFEARLEYLESKVMIAEMAGREDILGLYKTNAQLTAILFGAKKKEYNDEFNYKYPKELDLSKIPQEIKDFITKYQKQEIDVGSIDEDDESFSFKLNFDLAGCPHKFTLGGLHGAIPNYSEQSTEDRVIVSHDVESYYPSLIIEYDYLSRNVEDRSLFVKIKNARVEAKANNDKKKSNALKKVINGVFGASIRDSNDLYDPLNGRSICLTGQLFLIELIQTLISVDTFKLIQSNTDGIIYSVSRNNLQECEQIIQIWEITHRLKMEETFIDKIAQKDVNNYIMIENISKKLKLKGAYVNTYNNFDFRHGSYAIVAHAIVDYLMFGVPVEETINNCNDLKMFQFIAKSGKTYDYVVLK